MKISDTQINNIKKQIQAQKNNKKIIIEFKAKIYFNINECGDSPFFEIVILNDGYYDRVAYCDIYIAIVKTNGGFEIDDYQVEDCDNRLFRDYKYQKNAILHDIIFE